MTFSIAARSADGQWWGVAVGSKVLAVGRAVPAAEAKVGAVATQAFCNLTFRERGLAALRSGASAQEAVDRLISEDDKGDVRQVGIVDSTGASAAHTGSNCIPYSGHATGPGYSIQGNLLSGPQVIQAMEEAWLATDESDPLVRRLVATLLAGDRAGGDRRGRQSAGLLVVTENGAHEGDNDRYADLRVDDHLDPVLELSRLVDIAEVALDKHHQAGSVPLDEGTLRDIAKMLHRIGFAPGGTDPEAVTAALRRWTDDNYLSRRLLDGAIDNEVLHILRQQSGEAWRTTA